MRIVRTRAKPGNWPQFEKGFFIETPKWQGVPGLQAIWILHDLDDREAGFVVALWNSEADALAFEMDRTAERNPLLTNPLPGESEYYLGEIRSVWIAPQPGDPNADVA
jgi:hypothetical protein